MPTDRGRCSGQGDPSGLIGSRGFHGRRTSFRPRITIRFEDQNRVRPLPDRRLHHLGAPPLR